MAKNGKQYTKIAGTWEQIKPSYTDLVDVPTDFNPSAHDHTLSEITDAGTVAAIDTNASTTQFLRGDGTWATPADSNTTYTAGSGLSLTGTEFTNTAPDQTVSLTGSGATTVTGTYPNFTISSTDTNTVYTHPTHPGDDINIDTGALSGATVISDLDFNITSDTLGHITDANATIATRNLTATDIGLGNVTNESKSTMFSSPSFTGTPTAPTASSSVNNTQIATTAFVTNKLAGVAGGLNFAGTIDLSPIGGKNGDDLAAAGLSSPGDYLIVNGTGVINNDGSTFVTLAVQAPGDEGDSTIPVTLETGDWIVYVGGDGSTMTVSIINNTDTRFAPTVHTHSIGNVTGLQTALNGKLGTSAKAADSNLLDGIDSSGFMRGGRQLSNPNTISNGGDRYDPNSNNPTNEHYAILTYGNGGNVTGQLATHFVNGATYNRAHNASWSAWSRMFDDDYHPNADKWTTARTLSLSGDASGSVSWDGSGNATLSVAVANDSHTHDGRYYTESEANSRFINASGDTMSGTLTIDTGGTNDGLVLRGTNPTISFLDDDSGADDFYIHINSHNFYVLRDTAGSNIVGSGWDSPHPLQLEGDTNRGYLFGNRIFADNYHPNADRLTTARNIALSGDVTGSANFDGSGNISITTTVADDSHNHTWSNIDGGSVNGWGGLRHSTSSGYIDFGPANSGTAHIYTDRPSFYFNKELYMLGNRVFHDGYHPNADKWTTARTLSLTGDASGSTSWDGSGNASISVVVNNDSHNHDGRYYTESESDGRYLKKEADSTLDMNNNDIYGVDQIFHHGDTNTYMQFHASDQWRVVTGGGERLEVNNSETKVSQNFRVTGNRAYFQATDTIAYFGHPSTGNEAEIRIDTTQGGSPQISFTEHGDMSWAIGGDDADNSFKIHGFASATVPTINSLAVPIFELTTGGQAYVNGDEVWDKGNLSFSLSGSQLTITTS